MESSWGRNVRFYGVGAAGATLAARFLVAPNVILTNGRDKTNPALVLAWQLPDLVTQEMIPGGINVTGLGNFPYGFDVEPNVPL